MIGNIYRWDACMRDITIPLPQNAEVEVLPLPEGQQHNAEMVQIRSLDGAYTGLCYKASLVSDDDGDGACCS